MKTNNASASAPREPGNFLTRDILNFLISQTQRLYNDIIRLPAEHIQNLLPDHIKNQEVFVSRVSIAHPGNLSSIAGIFIFVVELLETVREESA